MKDIKEILQTLDLDLSNPEVVRAASDAIKKILAGRQGGGASGDSLSDRLSGKATRPTNDEEDTEPIDLGEFEQEIDPNLIQPPENAQMSSDEVETEIEDEENVLDKIKQLGDSSDTGDSNNDGSGNGNSGNGKPPQVPPQKPEKDPTSTGEDSTMPSGSESSSSSDSNSSGGSDNSDGAENTSSGGDSKPLDNAPKGNNGSEGSETSNSSDNAGDTVEGTGTSDSDTADEDEEDDELGNGAAGGTSDDETDDELEGENADADFASKVAGANPKNEAQQIQIGRTISAAEKAIEKAEEAGQSSIVSILEGCVKALEKMLDELNDDPNSEINEQKLSQVIQKTLDAISAVDKSGLTFKSEEERSQQVKKIKDTMSDAGTVAELSAEDVEQIRADKQAIVNNQREIDKYSQRSRSSFKGFEEFLVSLRKALAMQVESEKTKAGSWAAINRRYDGTSVVKPGIKNKTLPSSKVPVIDFYFDCSASWGDHDLEKGNEALSKIAQLEKDGELKINVFYFADNVYADKESPRYEGGTGAWNRIIENIILTKATNVVIMTDRDMQHQCHNPPHKAYKVTGFVWYLWRDGECAQKLPNLLQGRCGTMQYSFSSN